MKVTAGARKLGWLLLPIVLVVAQALRITGTPGFVVGRQILRGAVDLHTLQQVISKARAKQ